MDLDAATIENIISFFYYALFKYVISVRSWQKWYLASFWNFANNDN